MTIRHYSTREAHSESWWRYEVSRKMIVLIIRRRTLICVDVCAPTRPRYGAYPVIRIDKTTWRLVPERYVGRLATAALVPVARPIHFMLDGDALDLADAPIHVSQSIAELADP